MRHRNNFKCAVSFQVKQIHPLIWDFEGISTNLSPAKPLPKKLWKVIIDSHTSTGEARTKPFLKEQKLSLWDAFECIRYDANEFESDLSF